MAKFEISITSNDNGFTFRVFNNDPDHLEGMYIPMEYADLLGMYNRLKAYYNSIHTELSLAYELYSHKDFKIVITKDDFRSQNINAVLNGRELYSYISNFIDDFDL